MAVRTRDYKLEYAKRKARAVLKEREAKRGKPLSESYRKRLEKGLLKGRTVQEARGHKPGEARVRRERKQEREENAGLTNAQVAEVFKFGEARAYEIKESELDGWDYVAAAQASGWGWFLNYRKIYRAVRANFIAEMANGTYASRGLGYLTDLANRAKVDDISWLYYH